MNGASRRAALAALESARPLLVRSPAGRNTEDLAADLVEIGRALDAAVRALVGGSAGDPAYLVGSAREKGMLSLDGAHTLVAAFAAWERVKRPGHLPTAEEVAALRDGHAALESSLAPRAEPVSFDANLATAPVAAAPAGFAPPPLEPARKRRRMGKLLPLALAAALLLAAAIGAWYWMQGANERAVKEAARRYAAGDRAGAQSEFERIAREEPRLALPHVYLGRLARERGDAATAQRELTLAVSLDNTSALANRELAAHLLAIGNLGGAQRFYARAIERDGDDRVAQGWLACVLHRQGNYQGAQRFAMRAGQGPWQSCLSAPPTAPPPVAPPLPAP